MIGGTERKMLIANASLARVITEAIGDGWISDLTKLRELKPLAGDSVFQESFRKAKREAKSQFVHWLNKT